MYKNSLLSEVVGFVVDDRRMASEWRVCLAVIHIEAEVEIPESD